MKKNLKYIIFSIAMLFFSLANIKATEKELVVYDWSIKQGATSNYLYYDETLEDEDGYVTITTNENLMGVMRKITKDGKEIIWEQTSDIGMHYSLRKDDNYYYTVTFTYNYSNYGDLYLCRYTNDGIVDECVLLDGTTEYMASEAEIYITEDGLEILTAGLDNSTNYYGPYRIYKITSNDELTVEEKINYNDLTEAELNEITNGRNFMFYDEWESIIPEEYDEIYISNIYIDTDATYAVGDIEQEGKLYGFIAKIDNENKLEWFKKANENTHYFDVTGSSAKYVVVVSYNDEAPIGYPRNPDNVETSLLVYSTDGEILETHDVAEEIGTERADVTHILPFGSYLIAHASAYDENGELSSYAIRYMLNYFITTVTDGKGNVEIVESSEAGKEITFKVTPEKGYELKEVKITDANGNIIIFTENTFTMPSSDVTIEVTFVESKKNPETADVAVIACLAIIILGGIGTIYSIKKLSWLK